MEVLIVQMGKVASTAIAEALRRGDCEVLQAHIAAPERLQEKLRIMTSPVVGDDVATRMYADYLQELRVTFLLARLRARNTAGAADARVISLTRDPLSWYWSHFAQNYDHYSTLLAKYARHHHPEQPDVDPAQMMAEVQAQMFAVLERTQLPLDDAQALPGLMAEADALDPTGVVFSQANRFLVPLRWFNEDFLPATGVDVYDHGFDRGRGVARIDRGGMSILLLRYEDLPRLDGDIAAFTGVEALALERANVSEDKHIPFSIKAMQQRGQALLTPALIERIYATRYARHFGYPLAAAGEGPGESPVAGAE